MKDNITEIKKSLRDNIALSECIKYILDRISLVSDEDLRKLEFYSYTEQRIRHEN